jgi:hypothetical protein
MAKRKSNVECITDIMEFSSYGPLAQAFVMDALAKHAERIAGMPLEELKGAFGTNPMIGAEAWQGVAKEIKTKLDQHFAN